MRIRFVVLATVVAAASFGCGREPPAARTDPPATAAATVAPSEGEPPPDTATLDDHEESLHGQWKCRSGPPLSPPDAEGIQNDAVLQNDAVRRILIPKARGGTASNTELRMLRAACYDLGDEECCNLARDLLTGAPVPVSRR